MMPRRYDPEKTEMMDRPQPVSEMLAEDLQNLERMNRLFGGHRILRKIVTPWLKRDRPVSILDLATGAGDNPRLIESIARGVGCPVAITALDANPATLTIARARAESSTAIEFVEGDILTYPLDRTFDIVMCTLALHHFSAEDSRRILERMRALTHGHALVVDLARSRLGSAGVWLLTELWMRNAMTRHDGRLSMQRAWSFAELAELGHSAGWRDVRHRRFAVARQALWY